MKIMGVRENVMRKIGNIFKILFWAAPFSTAVTVLYYICQAIIPALSTILFTGILQGVIELQEGNRELLIKNVAIYLGMRGGMYFLNYGYSVLVNTGIFEKGSMCFRQFLQEKTARMPLYNMENSKILDQKKRAERTVEEDVPAMVFYQFLEAASAAFGVVAVLGIMLDYHWVLALAAILAVLPFPIVKVIRGKSHVRVKNSQSKMVRKMEYYWKILTGKDSAKELRVLGCQEYLSRLWKKESFLVREQLWMEKKKDAVWCFLCDIIQFAGYIGALLLAVGLAVWGQMEACVFGALISALLNLQNCIKVFLEAVGELPELLSLYNNYDTYLKLGEEFKEKEDKRCVDRQPQISFSQKKICLEHVFFSYPEMQKNVLEDICLDILPGEHIAIVGENGSGKSTLAKLILGLYPVLKGTIRWGEIDLNQRMVENLYRHISVVSQNFVKYYLTLRENIGISCVEKLESDPEIIRVLEQVGFTEKISLNQQLGTEYGGVDFSLGQWQKLAIARGILRNAEIIVMDEPTSALDAITENEVLNLFMKVMEEKTALLISHRIGICCKMDKIVVMKKGRIVEIGSHEELLRKNGEYARLYWAQAGWYQEK